MELAVPVGGDEARRLKILQESTLLDSSTTDPSFDRYTSLCRRLYNVNEILKPFPYSLQLFVMLLTSFF